MDKTSVEIKMSKIMTMEEVLILELDDDDDDDYNYYNFSLCCLNDERQ